MRDHRHAGTENPARVARLVEDDLDRHALDHLHVVAGGVFRRQQREGGAAAGLKAVNAAVKNLAGRGIDIDLDWVAIRICERSVSLKFAVTQTLSGTSAIRSWPTWI